MASFTKTITNSVRVFGLNPSSKWGQANAPYTMTWGTTKWGEGTFPQVFKAGKVITDSVVTDTSIAKASSKLIENSMVISIDPVSEKLAAGIWDVVFISNTTEAEDRDTTSWSAPNSSATSFTCMTAGTTTWS